MRRSAIGDRRDASAACGAARGAGGHARPRRIASLALALLAAAACIREPARDPKASGAGRDAVILATTTSTYDTGLLDELIERFEETNARMVKTIAVGTGKALALASRGEADIVLVHAPDAEERFMNDGGGWRRRKMMFNDFILVGPDHDPAGAASGDGILTAMRAISETGAPFVSRGDESGTHHLENRLWDRLGARPAPGGSYLETGQGMAATLRVASEKRAYTLTDRGTYLAQRDNLDLDVLSQGDPLLLNVYHVIVVNPSRGPRVNLEGAEALARFLLSEETLAFVGEFGRERYGRPLFVPDGEPYDRD